MKQIVQDIKSGETNLIQASVPSIDSKSMLIQTSRSLVSLGTEKMLIEFGKANYFSKAIQQPEKVKMIFDKLKNDGIEPTIKAVFSKLNKPIPLGYCNVGTVVEIGDDITEFKIGDRVVSNGNHAEFVCVPQNLTAKIPDNVSDEEAVFTVIGSVGLQGIRLLKPTFGETVVVFGLGLVGLLTAELLVANGCNVIGFDFDSNKVQIAKSKGIDAIDISKDIDPVNYVNSITNDIGVDGVIIAASNKNNDIVSQSAKICRKRGRVVLVGVVGLNLARSDFYEKEITFQVSCSYGAGRYDYNYEQQGQDYPIGYVRWTEKRNFEAILSSISKKQLNVIPLISTRVELEKYKDIYDNINNSNLIASILVYKNNTALNKTICLNDNNFKNLNGTIGIIGSGNFASSILLPKLTKITNDVSYISSLNGLSSSSIAKKYNINNSTSNYNDILNDSNIDTVFIVTRHDTHYSIVIDAMKAGKNIFVEKPLAINQNQLDKIIDNYKNYDGSITVGFNRRFSKLSIKAKELIGENNVPINIVATMNAGSIDIDNWVHELKIGGGRIIGEACHYIDLCSYLTNSEVISVCMNSMGRQAKLNTDNASILLKYKNGSNAVINYFSNGSKKYSKERIEIYTQGRNLIIDNWKKLIGKGFKRFNSLSTNQDKGHSNQYNLFIDCIKNKKTSIISFNEIINTTKTSFGALQSLKQKKWIDII